MTRSFTIREIPVLTGKLTPNQRALLDYLWNQAVATGKPFPTRGLPKIVGKESVEDLFVGLNGCLVFERLEQGVSCLNLTLYGALLTGHGPAFGALLVRLLDLVRDLYQEDVYLKELRSDGIQMRLELSDAETKLLFSLLKLGLPPNMPIYLAGWASEGDSWIVAITDEVMALFRTDDTLAYLDDRLSMGYRPDEPWAERDRLTRTLENQNLALSMAINSQVPIGPEFEQSSSYVDSSRLDVLRAIKNATFDCTRLISMCEELNDCAAHGNAHAVIFLTRAILDHVPPAFGLSSFTEVASNYGAGGRSLKKSFERLENHSRHVADRLLHMPIRKKEVAPRLAEVSFAAELESVLAELCRILK